MEYVITNENARRIDDYLINDVGINSIILMENVAFAVAEAVEAHQGKVAILLGNGNNSGDGIALMRILTLKGRQCVGIRCSDLNKLPPDALNNYRIASRLGLEFSDNLSDMDGAGIIVDALFGIGLNRNITGKPYEAISYANRTDAYRIAIDVPSGINGDTGTIMGIVFRADETVTVQAIKKGMLLTSEREAVGKITVCKIGLPNDERMNSFSVGTLIDNSFVQSLLPDRKLVSNKGTYGRSLIIAGSKGMKGAALMASTAALTAGSGLVNAFVPKDIADVFINRPEIMLNTDESELVKLLDKATAIGIGCGCGNDDKIKSKLKQVLISKKPCVIDADAINTMDSEGKSLLHDKCIITPHPLEMSRFLGCTVSEVIENPVKIALQAASHFGCTVILKSATTIVATSGGEVRFNISGNPGLAKGGSGDVLTGIVTALLAQHLNPFDAASAGAFILGASADEAVNLLKNRMLIASDVIEYINAVINN